MSVASGAVVLAGGQSSRMGTPKAALEWHGSTLLRRTVGILARAAGGPVVVVRASEQDLPALPAGTLVVDDPRVGRGPLQGIAAGLAALAGRADTAFVASTDLPFLHPAFIRAVLRVLHGPGEGAGAPEGTGGPDRPDIALPVARGYQQPLAAGYRTSLAGLAGRLIEEERLKPAFLFAKCAVTRVDDAALLADPVLAALDPDLDSVLNVNTPGDYRVARARPAPLVTVRLPDARATGGQTRRVRAASVGEAASAVGLPPGPLTATVNGGYVTRDPEAPLTAGDVVGLALDDLAD
jgi:molybdopterin-guanine dinucleotide biosynthesis protein A